MSTGTFPRSAWCRYSCRYTEAAGGVGRAAPLRLGPRTRAVRASSPRSPSAAYGAGPLQDTWQSLSRISALGGVILFASAGFFVMVMVGTLLAGKRGDQGRIEWAEALGEPEGGFRPLVWDRLGLWIAVAVVLVVIAYAVPLANLLSLPRFGSPGFKPF